MKGPGTILFFLGTSSLLALVAPLGACSDPAQPDPVTGTGGATSGTVSTGGPTTGIGGMGTVSTGAPTTGTTGTPTTGVTSVGGSTGVTSVGGSTSVTSVGGSTSSAGPTTGGTATGAGGMGTTATEGTTTGGSTCDTSGGGAVIDPTFATFKAIIQYSNPTCAASDCHGNNPANALNLLGDDATIYMNLLNTMSEACGNIPVVDPGNPEGSALVMLLKGPCGDLERMPRLCNDIDCNCVPDNYIAAVEQWISDGAPMQ